ncbi:MAG: GNAT family N-acetyltransferase [Candidatus Hydrogenedentes bacterium]|nr:GNAT family N-acetyltransferase [Candidatus Hydrogenedentota bacterium]
MEIYLHSRPAGLVAEAILSIVADLTGEWFTTDVAPATERDLLFQDVFCAIQDGRIRSFIMFTSHDGAIHITLTGTSPAYRGQGIGSALMKRLELHAGALGFDEIVVFTVPPASKPVYQATVDFYRKHGFKVVKEYRELWQNGALELRKSLRESSQY